jgi:hypothetical protein
LRPEISPSVATIAVAHASLGGYLKWKDEEIVKSWVSGEFGPFYKVICQARDIFEWQKAKAMSDCIIIKESNLDNLEVAISFKPTIIDKGHKYLEFQLYKG